LIDVKTESKMEKSVTAQCGKIQADEPGARQ